MDLTLTKNMLKDAFTYHFDTNKVMLQYFEEFKEQISDRSLPLFSHCLNAQQIWNARILDQAPLGVHAEHSIEQCKVLNKQGLDQSVKIVDEVDLNRKIVYKNSRGNSYENSVVEVLFQISNHFTHHRGQLISDLRQVGIEPPMTDYIFYKR